MPSENQTLHHKPPVLRQFAREMRKEPSKAENILWQVLCNRQIDGLKFRRQHVLGKYIVDFCCIEHGLVVEFDGDSHAEQEVYDEHRTNWLESQGFRVIRFSNFDVLENLGAVVEEIQEACRLKA
jgi:5-methyltetrahydrofolate--homocysteine methyltransferase